MYKPILLPLARLDIKDSADWYNTRQKGLGKRFTAEVREKVNFIRQNPKAVAIRYDHVRTAVLDVFPFMIHYTIDEDRKAVVISGVFHTSRNPDSWRREG